MNATVAPFPRLPLFGVITALGLVLLAAGAARIVGFAHATDLAPAPIAAALVTFSDMPDGAVAVRAAQTGMLIASVPARAGGFLRSTMRVLATERESDGIGPQKPFALQAFSGGRLTLTDTATGQVLELEAFGPSNAAEFETILQKAAALP